MQADQEGAQLTEAQIAVHWKEEEYFHPSEVQGSVDPSLWTTLPSRVESSTRQILDVLDLHDAKATFFVSSTASSIE